MREQIYSMMEQISRGNLLEERVAQGLAEALEENNTLITEHLSREKRIEKTTINAVGIIGIVSGVVAYLLFKNEIDMPSAKYATSVLGLGMTSIATIAKTMK